MIYNTSQLLEIIEKNDEVYFYGAGKVCKAIINQLDNLIIKSRIKRILVSDKTKNPCSISGIKIEQIDEAEIDKKTLVIVATRENLHDAMLKTLSENGFYNVELIGDPLALYAMKQTDTLYWVEQEKETVIYDIKQRLLKFVPRPFMEYLIINILDHCNLRCKGCDHFACIADPYFVPYETIQKDVEKISEILHGDNVMKIAVMGGEPLLHPELLDILVVVRKSFPYAIIRLSTNGLLLLKQKDEFWRVCRENDITIVNTKYPLNLDYERMKEKAAEEKVKYQFFEGSGTDVAKTSFKKVITLEGTNDPVTSFSDCHISNYGNFLMEGKFYGCPFSCQSHRVFNKKFNQNLRMTEKDYLDIYKVQDMQELFEFSAKPRPYCRYCSTLERGHEWTRSNQEMSEWV